jgi:hypothetical protein
MGTYPSFAFTPDDSSIIIWASGQIWHVPIIANILGERTRSDTDVPEPIKFVAKIEARIAETRTATTEVVKHETRDGMRVRALQDIQVNKGGDRVVFTAAGKNYVQDIGKDSRAARALPALQPDAAYFSPSFVPNAEHFIVHARWSNVNFTSFELALLPGDRAYPLEGLPLGRFSLPTVCECSGRRRTLVFIKTAGDWLTGDTIASAKPGLWRAEFDLPDENLKNGQQIKLHDVRFVTDQVKGEYTNEIRFIGGSNRELLVQTPREAYVLDLSTSSDVLTGSYPVTALAKGKTSLYHLRRAEALLTMLRSMILVTSSSRLPRGLYRPCGASLATQRMVWHG